MKVALVSIFIGFISIFLGWVIQMSLRSMYKVLRNGLVTETSRSAQVGGFIGMELGMTIIIHLPMIATPHIIVYLLFRYTETGIDIIRSFRTDPVVLILYIVLYAIMIIVSYVRDQLKDLAKYMDLSVSSNNTRQVIYVALMIVIYMILVLGTVTFFIYQVAKLTSL